jgi:hypothetical protein
MKKAESLAELAFQDPAGVFITKTKSGILVLVVGEFLIYRARKESNNLQKILKILSNICLQMISSSWDHVKMLIKKLNEMP